MKSFPLRFALLMTMALSSSALGQVRIAPLAGTQLCGKDTYNDSPFLGAAASIKMNQRLLLSLEYQGLNSNHLQHLVPPDRVSQFSSRISTNSGKQLFLAGLQYDLYPLSRKAHVVAGLHLGYQYLNSESDLFNVGSRYIPPPDDHQEGNLLGISSLSLNYELFHWVSPYIQFRYGHRLGNLRGGGLTDTRHFAQLLFGVDVLVF